MSLRQRQLFHAPSSVIIFGSITNRKNQIEKLSTKAWRYLRRRENLNSKFSASYASARSHGNDWVPLRSGPFQKVVRIGVFTRVRKKSGRLFQNRSKNWAVRKRWTRNRKTGPVQVHFLDVFGFHGWHQAGFYGYLRSMLCRGWDNTEVTKSQRNRRRQRRLQIFLKNFTFVAWNIHVK